MCRFCILASTLSTLTYFKADWPNRSVYEAMFNTGLGDEAVIQLILALFHQSQPASRAVA